MESAAEHEHESQSGCNKRSHTRRKHDHGTSDYEAFGSDIADEEDDISDQGSVVPDHGLDLVESLRTSSPRISAAVKHIEHVMSSARPSEEEKQKLALMMLQEGKIWQARDLRISTTPSGFKLGFVPCWMKEINN